MLNTRIKLFVVFTLDVVLERPFSSLILLEGMTINLSCTPKPLSSAAPLNIPLCWTHNGAIINTNNDETIFTPLNYNYNLIVQSASISDSGTYHCIAAPAKTQSIRVKVVASEKFKIDFTCVLCITSYTKYVQEHF